jgi:branched-chain amino acid transport system substrate-binding protein
MTAPFEPMTYYPSGKRNYARVVATSDYEGPAAALLVKQLNRKSIYLLHDQYGEGTFSALACRAAARKLGLIVKGFEEWNAQASDYRALAKRIERSSAEAVYLGGIVEDNGGRLLKDLRAALGTRVAIVAFGGFMPFSETFRTAGSAAAGLYVSDTSYPNERLTGKARAFVAGFDRYARPAHLDLHVLNSAQAAEVLLDSIAQSDGTRSSVNANIFETSVRDGILGTFRIDARGDTTLKGVTFFKLLRGRAPLFEFVVVPKRLSG